MHPVVAKLSAKRRRELLANPLFVKLDEARQRDLLDCVLDLREQLPRADALDKLRPQREREIAEMKSALATIRKLLGDEGLVEEIKDYHGAARECDHIDLDAIETLLRAIGPVSEIVERFKYAADDGRQQRTRYPRKEAFNLADFLQTYFGIKVSLKTPDVEPNPSLELIGLLADPPASAHVILYRLRR